MPDIEKQSDLHKTLPRVLIGLAAAALVAFFAGVILANARRWGWTLGWIYVGLLVATLTINLACLLRWNPELIRRRLRLSRFTKTWDRVWAVLSSLAFVAIFVVAIKQTHDGVLREPGAGWLVGLVVFSLGWTLAIWSMVVNPFFEKTVRIQTEYGHHVIDRGPYAYMRHPGYVGFAGWILSTPLLLASTGAFVPALIAIGLLVMRTALEDRMLQAELPGYAEYTTRVRFRLIPGLW